MALVVTVPSADWRLPVERAAYCLSGHIQTISRDGSNKSRDKPSVGNDEVARWLHDGFHVIGIAHDPMRLLPSSLMNSADAHIEIAAPDASLIRQVLARCVGRAPCDVPDRIGGLTFSEITCAFRKGASPARVVAALRSTSLAKTRAAATGRTPPLENLPGYSGEALQWGLDLAADIAAWRQGQVAWTELSASAVLHGPPGTGKTLFARALARSCGLAIVSTSVGNWFTTKGDLGDVIMAASAAWGEAMASRPSLFFIDEIDGLPDRSQLDADRLSWWGPVVNYVLTMLDGAATDRTGVVVLGATNLVARVDPALLRPGRLERLLEVPLPGALALADIVAFHCDDALPASAIAPMTRLARGASAADAANWARRAKRDARAQGRAVTLADVQAHIAPPDRRSERDIRTVAIHEAGHAVVAVLTGRVLSSVSLASSGSIGGATTIVQDFPRFPCRADVERDVLFLLAGRAAEIASIGAASTGAESDLAEATRMLAALHASVGLGRDLVHSAPSGQAATLLGFDPELRRVVADDLARLHGVTLSMIKLQLSALEAIADGLITHRFLEGVEAKALFEEAQSRRTVHGGLH